MSSHRAVASTAIQFLPNLLRAAAQVIRCRLRSFGFLAVVPIIAGCDQPNTQVVQSAPTARPTQSKTGVVIMLPGVEGGAWQLAEARAGLAEAGVHDEIDTIEWGARPFGSLVNLMDLKANRQRAQDIAERITTRLRAEPDRRIQLVGYSGGGGLALLVTEALPTDVKLDRLVLIAAAVAPTHDLGPALAQCRRGIVNFHSEEDWFILGVGTRTFGTIDRVQSDSAGRIGFRTAEGQPLARPGLTQVAWRDDWRKLGHFGGHIGWLARGWSREVLGPALTKQS